MTRIATIACAALALTGGACARSNGEKDTSRSSSAAGAIATDSPTSRGADSASAAGVASQPKPTDTLTARVDKARMQGDSSAPVWVIMGSDFQCPFCKRWHDESFGRLMTDYVRTGKVRVAFVNYPMRSLHPHAVVAAEAAMCSAAQGQFWPMHDSLFATQERWVGLPDPRARFETILPRGVNLAAWRQCMSTHATRGVVDGDQARLAAAGVRSTPTIFIGATMMEGAQPYDSLRTLITAQLRKMGLGR